MNVFKYLLVVFLASAGVACSGSSDNLPALAESASQGGQSSQKFAQLEFIDSRIFDEKLSHSMSDEKPMITVIVPAAFHLNEIPERVDRWLYAISEEGGSVAAKPENPSRGIVSAAIDIVVSVLDKIDEARLYGPSKNYNATLLYNEDGMVNKILFNLR